MIKNIKKQILFSIFLFSLLLVSCLNSLFVVPVSAVDEDFQNTTMEILNDVISLNQKNYSTIVNSIADDQFRNLAQKEVDVRLVSVDGSVRVKTSFVNEVLRQIYITNYKGDFTETKSVSDTTESAKNFLKNYRNYTEDSFYYELSSMLDNVDVTKNTTKTTNNIKLEVFNTEQKIVDYVWTYQDENGIVAESKNVILSYRNGQLNVFLNNWPLYKVATAPKISAEDATKIALEAANTFSYEVIQNNTTSTISDFEIAPESLGYEILNYQNFPSQTLAREKDPFTLYPSWYVPVGFNKTYPGGVTGLTVTIWADTGEISSINKMRVGFNPETPEEQESIITSDSNSLKDGLIQNPTMSFIPLAIITSVGAFGIAMFNRKKIKKITRTKKLFLPVWGTLLCGLLMVIAVFTPTQSAFAVVNPDCKAEIYAPYDLNPTQLPEEIVAADYIVAQIKSDFQTAGYTATNWTDDAVTFSGVLSNASYDETHYDRVALFHFGHMSTWNSGYQDGDGDNSTNINATLGEDNIDNYIDSQRHHFVFIWVCAQAQNPNVGSTAAAWTQRTNLDPTGYSTPDNLGQVYIGFEGFSPPINNVSAFQGLLTDPMYYWIEDFYDYALCDEYIINDAINQATLDFFDTTFSGSVLTNYTCWWGGTWNETTETWDNRGYQPGKMKIFGDGSMGAFNPTLSISSSAGGYTNPSGSPSFTFGDPALVYAHAYTNYVFSYWTLDGEYYSSNSLAQVPMEEDHTLQAVFSYVPPTYALSISAGAGGTTSPSPGVHYYSSGTPVQVTASNYTNYYFDHWNLDGNTYYNNPITVTMNNNHNLQAYFTYNPPPPPTYPLTVNAYTIGGGAIYVPFYLDGQYVGTTMSTYYVTAGTHSVAVPGDLPPYLTFAYWSGGVSGGTVNVQGSTTISAYYYFHAK